MRPFIVSLLLICCCLPPRASEAQFRPLASSGSRTLTLVGDSLWVVDAETLSATNAGRPEWLDSFHETTLPANNSGAWDDENDVFWIWDNSVGSTVKISATGETLAFSPRRSSHVQYEHAGGLHPVDRVPIAYSGYGYYRAKEYMVSYSPDADTWVEIPYSGDMPEPRMGALMMSGFQISKVVITGGIKAEEETYPPVYNLETTDAWAFDFETFSWEQLPFEPWLSCGLRFTRGLLGDVPVQHEKALLFWPDQCNLPMETDFQIKAGVLTWDPFSGEVALLGMIENLPTPFHLLGLHLDENHQPVVTVSGRDEQDWAESLLHVDIQPVDTQTLTMSTPIQFSPWWLIFLGLVIPGVILWTRTYKRITVSVDTAAGVVTFKKGLTRHVTTPSQSVIQLAHAFASSNSKTHVSGDLVSNHFDDLVADPDASRVAKNRAVNDLNELSTSLGLGNIIERKRSPVDKRKFDYESAATFSLKEK